MTSPTVLTPSLSPVAALVDWLRAAGVRFETVHHPVVFTAQELAAVLGISGRHVAKVLVLQRATELHLAVLPAHRRWVATSLPGWSLAPEPVIRERLPGLAPGAVPPFGRWLNLPLIADVEVPESGPFACAAGTTTDALVLDAADWHRVEHPPRLALG